MITTLNTEFKPGTNRWFRRAAAGLLALSLLAAPLAAMAEAASPAAAGGPTDPKEVEAFADSFFETPEIKDKLTGAAFTVVADGKVVLNKGYGYADVESRLPVDPDKTMFRMASVSKLFTATALMQLVEEGKVSLDDKVEQYLNGITFPNKTGKPLLIRHLLTHTTGFEFTDSVAAPSEQTESGYSLEQFIKDARPNIVIPPGEAYRYDNYAFNLQGLVVQNVTGKPFEEVVEERIFDPLGMDDSDFEITGQVTSQLATGYDKSGKAYPVYPMVPAISPDGGMFATNSDIAKYMLANLNGGKLGDQRILNADTTALMHKVHVGIHEELPNAGLGFEMFFHQSFNGQVVIGKGGDLQGYHSWLWLLPEKNVGGFIVTNTDAVDVRVALFDAFMDHYYPHADQPRQPIDASKSELQRYEGIYRNLRVPLLFYEVKPEQGYLLVKDIYGESKLRQVGPLLFQDERGNLAAFKEDGSGKVAYFYYTIPDSWAAKAPELEPYKDVPAGHEYAEYIYKMRSLGASLDLEHAESYGPAEPVTRAEFAAQILKIAGINPSRTPSVFKDVRGHRYEPEIQTLTELQAIQGTKNGKFKPDRPITREEAAYMLHRFAKSFGFPDFTAKLAGKTSAWAEESVQFIVGAGLYGPEVTVDEKGAAHFRSKDRLLRQESALMLIKLIDIVKTIL
ncbi:beta-lactamase family protein [Paenibacillus tarimensis]|uniref:beta-lactamase family protein n=1 Tax=Paenibacillus tarimensis TaxID=416012 RepID=UPI001F3A8B74|nr:beta-lactamase family protein [Paenibacillus tarimensis]MCF2944578.1 beta-lactamase family protein [Paenibacillus tarimensis]